ncbi:MAG: phosphoribosylglycinamide formyltransferase [Bacteroidales bacterium]|nr:phosphoribosylglycinamide formyltransferase [Bacteroidales bacterium]
MKRIAIFASGNGSNAQRIAEYFTGNNAVEVAMILSNRQDAFVLKRANRLGIPARVFDRSSFYKTDEVLEWLVEAKIDLIVLAGFLWLVPSNLVAAYPNRILNIHPALLPGYGGKGMYGDIVHKAVIDAGETESGITIHFVDEKYDHGNIIFQATCKIEAGDTPEKLAHKVHQLEHKHYPKVIEHVLYDRISFLKHHHD